MKKKREKEEQYPNKKRKIHYEVIRDKLNISHKLQDKCTEICNKLMDLSCDKTNIKDFITCVFNLLKQIELVEESIRVILERETFYLIEKGELEFQVSLNIGILKKINNAKKILINFLENYLKHNKKID